MAMIVEYLDSFDYPAAEGAATVTALQARGWTVTNTAGGTLQLVSTGVITGDGSVRANPNASQKNIFRALSGNYASISIRLRVAIVRSTANGENLIHLRDGATTHLVLEITNSSGTLTLRRGDGTALITATNALSTDNDTDIEITCLIANSGGFAHLYVNGVEVDDAGGDGFSGDTQNGASAQINTVGIGQVANSNFDWTWDDLRIYRESGGGNATAMGPSRVYVKRPTGDTAQEDFTPSAGSDSYAMVDEDSPDGDTTYLSTATDAHKTRLTGEAVEGTVGVVLGVQKVTYARKTDAASRDIITGFTNAGGSTEDKSAAQALTTSYKAYYHTGEDYPGGSGLVASDISNIELLVEANQ